MFYFDESGFCGSPPVQSAWSPKAKPHHFLPAPHVRTNVLGLLNFGANTLHTQVENGPVTRAITETFLDQFISDLPTPGNKFRILVLDNASIHHNLASDLIDKWFVEQRVCLWYLPPYCPELNLIEIVWKKAKYHWREFATWCKNELREKVTNLMGNYGSKFRVDFS